MTEHLPLLVFACLSDIQYADVDDGYNFSKTRIRYYRNSLNMQKEAIEYWKNYKSKVEFVIHLGDIIDGLNRRHNISEKSLQTVLDAFEDFKVYHLIGNHELYNFGRENLLKSRLFSAKFSECQEYDMYENQFYYTFLPHPRLRIIVVDNYEIGTVGCPKDCDNYQIALEYLKKNINEDKNSVAGMEGLVRRFAMYNGAVSDQQLKWLDQVLHDCDQNKVNVLIAGHLPIHPESCDISCLCWNYEEILDILYKHSCVLSYISGHDHIGGNYIDEYNIQHITFQALLETPPDNPSPFATFSLFSQELYLEGHGLLNNYHLKLKYPITNTNS